MNARFFTRICLSAGLLAASALAFGQEDGPATLRFDAAQLQAAAEGGFPLQRDLLEGFATLSLSQPKVRIPVPGERVQLELDYDVELLTSRSAETGRFTVSSGLRYDPATRGLHLADPQLQDFQTLSSRGGLDAGTRGVVNALMQDYARDRPLYQLTEEELAQVPGQLTAQSLRVEDGQVVLRLGSPTGE
ncbi:DUF1439 domain-containing protein [Pseudoxanthomonas putridarboris]|uniref:DUF1439 domain-containing protein n=1 Tax=Pseudoxanthomonas putridarboris TaxID=752605 RepID=A0ABU9IXG4_9GAMM